MPESSYLAVDPANPAVARVVREKFTDHEAEIIRREAVEAAQAAEWRLALDLSNVTFLTSAGIGALVSIHKACAAAGGRLAVFGLSSQLLELLKITRLDRLITISPDRAAAVASLA